jgi:phosphatidylserine decarboxylase
MRRAQEAATRLLAQSYRFVPTNLVSRMWGHFTRTTASRTLIRPFARAFRIALQEAELDVADYPSLNAFFTRRLKSGSRPVDDADDAVACPVDGRVSAAGSCDRDRMLQIKGSTFDLFGLLRDGPMARHFEYGSYITLYLSPQDYHRIHAPLDMTIHAIGYMPGTLLPVNPPSVRWIPELYTQNERVIVYADGPAGSMAMVLVGAHCVGSISLTFHDFITNHPGQGPALMNLADPVSVNKGDEVGAFNMGSTVLLLFARDRVRLEPPTGSPVVRFGQRIGTVLGPDEPADEEPRREER